MNNKIRQASAATMICIATLVCASTLFYAGYSKGRNQHAATREQALTAIEDAARLYNATVDLRGFEGGWRQCRADLYYDGEHAIAVFWPAHKDQGCYVIDQPK